MANISKIDVKGTQYNLKDAQARSDLLNKQDTLVSGTNIKTVNNQSILGSGNIDIDSGPSYTAGDGIDIVESSEGSTILNTAGMYFNPNETILLEDSLGDDLVDGGYHYSLFQKPFSDYQAVLLANGITGDNIRETINTLNFYIDNVKYNVMLTSVTPFFVQDDTLNLTFDNTRMEELSMGLNRSGSLYGDTTGCFHNCNFKITLASTPTSNYIRTIYSDKAKTDAVYPITKVEAITNSTGTPLQTLLNEKGTVINIDAGEGLTGGPITSSGTLSVDFNWVQRKLVSGTDIKTINNESLLGSGNISISGSNIFIAEYNVTPFSTLAQATSNNKVIYLLDYGVHNITSVQEEVDYIKLFTASENEFIEYTINNADEWTKVVSAVNDGTLTIQKNSTTLGTFSANSAQNSTINISVPTKTSDLINDGDGVANYVTFNDAATSSTAGVIKLNPDESISLNANGQLDVGGRLGQYSGTTGVYSPKTISPAMVKNGSFLLTEASGTSLGSKSLAVSTGSNVALKTAAAAGATQYVIANNYANRILCAGTVGGVLALNEASAATRTVNIISVQINGSDFTPDSSADSSTNNIIITTDESVNPDSQLSAGANVRMYYNGGKGGGFSNLFVGQGVGGEGGASVIVGQKVFSKSGNACALVGADIFNQGNGNAVFGRQHISRKNRWFMAGTGHDNTNGRSETGTVFGQWADIQSDTLFAVGNGSSHTARSNAFEIKTNGDIYKNGVKVL